MIWGSGKKLLKRLLDVSISSPSNGQTLVYNSTTEKWENGSGGGPGGSGLSNIFHAYYNDGLGRNISAAPSVVIMDTEIIDTGSIYDPVTGKAVIPENAYYEFIAKFGGEAIEDGMMTIAILKLPMTIIASVKIPILTGQTVNIACPSPPISLLANDEITVAGIWSGAGSLSLALGYETFFSGRKIG